jgi:hypothetical protein
MDDTVKAGQVWQHKNSGRRLEIVRLGPEDDAGSANGRWQWVPEGYSPDHGTHLTAESVLVDDFILVKDAP